MKCALILLSLTLSSTLAMSQTKAPNVVVGGHSVPAAGSYFLYKHWFTKPDSALGDPSVVVDYVFKQDTALGDKKHVLIYQHGTWPGRSFQSYEENGDVSWYIGRHRVDSNSVVWERFPIVSKDTVVVQRGRNRDGEVLADTNLYLEAKDTTIEHHLWHAVKLKQIVSVGGRTTSEAILWFDSVTGWYLRMDLPPHRPARRGQGDGEEIHVFDSKID